MRSRKRVMDMDRMPLGVGGSEDAEGGERKRITRVMVQASADALGVGPYFPKEHWPEAFQRYADGITRAVHILYPGALVYVTEGETGIVITAIDDEGHVDNAVSDGLRVHNELVVEDWREWLYRGWRDRWSWPKEGGVR